MAIPAPLPPAALALNEPQITIMNDILHLEARLDLAGIAVLKAKLAALELYLATVSEPAPLPPPQLSRPAPPEGRPGLPEPTAAS